MPILEESNVATSCWSYFLPNIPTHFMYLHPYMYEFKLLINNFDELVNDFYYCTCRTGSTHSCQMIK